MRFRGGIKHSNHAVGVGLAVCMRTVGLIVGLRVGAFVGVTVVGKAVGLRVGLLVVVPGTVGIFFNGKRRR